MSHSQTKSQLDYPGVLPGFRSLTGIEKNMNQKRVNGGKVLRAIAVAFLCLTCVLASAKFAVPQDTATGKVVGTVKDQGGANISGAEISLLHQQRAVVATTTSDATGSFTIGNVAPGYYE